MKHDFRVGQRVFHKHLQRWGTIDRIDEQQDGVLVYISDTANYYPEDPEEVNQHNFHRTFWYFYNLSELSDWMALIEDAERHERY